MPRIREIAARTRTFIEDMRRSGVSDSELIVGVILAIQTIPATRALSENPEVAKILKRLGDFARAGAALFAPDESSDESKG